MVAFSVSKYFAAYFIFKAVLVQAHLFPLSLVQYLKLWCGTDTRTLHFY